MEELKTIDSCTFEEHDSLTFYKRLLLDDNCSKTHSEALEPVASKGLHNTATSSFPVPQQPRFITLKSAIQQLKTLDFSFLLKNHYKKHMLLDI